MAKHSIPFALVLVACSGSAESTPAPPSTTVAPARTETIASEHPFGCTLTPIVDGHVTWSQAEGPIADFAIAHEDGDGWLALPPALASSVPTAARVIVIATDAVCTATLGEPELAVEAVENQIPMIGRALSGCGEVYAPFALLCPGDAQVPDELRWAPLVWSEITALDDTVTDPMVRSAYRGREYYGWHIPEADRVGRTELVRGRSATITIATDVLGATQLSRAWFAAGTDTATGCPDAESVQAGIWRHIDADWERVAEGDGFVGVVRDATHVLALVESAGSTDCEGASVCSSVALYTPGTYGMHPFVRRGRALTAFGWGELEWASPVRLLDTRAPCNEEDE